MISNVILYKNLRFIWIFRQYRIKSAIFTSRNRIFVSRKDYTAFSVVPDPDFRSLGSGFLDNFLDPVPDWISFLLKPYPDTDYPKRYAWNTFYFFTF